MPMRVAARWRLMLYDLRQLIYMPLIMPLAFAMMTLAIAITPFSSDSQPAIATIADADTLSR